MKSLLIEFYRFDNLDIGALRAKDRYLTVAASHPVREVTMPLDQVPFLEKMDNLRYQAGAEERKAALKEMGEVVTGFIGFRNLPELEDGEFPLQLDLVVNAAELAALPFETVTDTAGQPLLVRRDRPVELTRRVRHDFAEIAVRWPARPRILYVWASPPGVSDVPHEQHEEALRAALSPWMPAQEGAGAGEVLAILSHASLSSLRKICADSITEKKPFTHVHVLAHGYPVGSRHRRRFGLALHDESGGLDAVLPEALTEALNRLRGKSVVVTLATCDAANMTNAIVPEKSIAHEFHVSGFPVVLASQLPLTVPGSILMVERFYKELLAGKDVRMALHETRVTLSENSEQTGHDWASLVGYVRLPEGYAEYLQEVRLEAVMASLKITRERSVPLTEDANSDLAELDEIVELLRERIQELESFLPETKKGVEAVHLENLGLLGSAQKRLAELFFARGKRSPDGGWQPAMREALEKACDWYRQGYQRNLSHHWCGVQYLSLQSILKGKIGNPAYWQAALLAAEIQVRDKPEEIWAHGSLAELHLLAPLAGQPANLEAAIASLETLKAQVIRYKQGDRFPIESTDCQLCRYRDWWTAANGFFPGRADLAADAARLSEALGQ